MVEVKLPSHHFYRRQSHEPLRRYPVLSTLLSPFRLSQQKTCAALIAALCQWARASGFAIAG
ncbi:MAG TPA: hypothetical protein VF591_00075 [Pyrinomonadaceae bacterium]